MNFLAHLFLSPPDAQSRLGALLPDLVRGPLPRDLPEPVRLATALHRRVDALTDTHPLFAQSRARLTSLDRRYRGIAADVLYDHFLARDWRQYSDQPLADFIADAHADLANVAYLAPAPTQVIIGRMIEQNWLSCYGTEDGLASVFDRMSARLTQRLERPVDLSPVLRDLQARRAALAEDFASFFPSLIATLQLGSAACNPVVAAS